MNILVTGGAGFIGSHVVDRMVEDGNDVMVLDDMSTGRAEYLNQEAQFTELDIQDERVSSVIEDFKPDIIIHLAAQKNVRVSLENPVLDAQINILGSLNLLEAARHNKVQYFIFVSTGGVYDEASRMPFTEHSPTRPASPYLQSKLVIDQYLDYYTRVHGMETLSLRLTNTYGPRQDPKGEAGVIAVFFEALAQGKQGTIFGTGEQTRDFVYIEDVVDAFTGALKKKPTGIINIATNRAISVTELHDVQAKIAGFSSEPKIVAAIPGEVMHHVMSYDKAQQELRWSPKVPLEQGLQKTWDWFNQ